MFEGGSTMLVQHRKGNALEGIHLTMKTDSGDWRFEAKTGTISDLPDGRMSVVLYDVQADMWPNGRLHKDHMDFTFRKVESKDATKNIVTTNLAQFTIGASDLAMPAALGTNGVGTGHDTIVIHLQFTAAKTDEFLKFTREHMHQQTQLLVGSKVVAEPYIQSEISGGQADLDFSSIDQAQAVADSLNKR
jgi:preprotein translocase subunit SecD